MLKLPAVLPVLLIVNLPQVLLHGANEAEVTKEFISSHSNLKRLAKIEDQIYSAAKAYYTSHREDLNSDRNASKISKYISRYLQDFEGSSGELTENSDERAEAIAAHPLLSFRMMYRVTRDFKRFRKVIPDNISKYFGNDFIWPVNSDLEETMAGILRILHIYDLDVEEFATGTIQTHVTGARLTARHCYALGKYALAKREYFALAVELLEFGKHLLQNTDDSTIDEEVLTKEMLRAVAIHDQEFDRLRGDYAETYFLRRIVRKKGNVYEYDGFVRRMKQRTSHYRQWKGNRDLNYNEINFWGLCSGHNLQTDEERSKLYCWHDSKSNPAWTLAPLQIELLSNSPYLIQIYNVLSDPDIVHLMEETEPALGKSKVFNNSSPTKQSLSTQRTSLNTWLREDRAPELYSKISRRIELITGLQVLRNTSSEILQIASYSFGGHYAVHMDAIQDPNEPWYYLKGDRIATFMIYLSDVKAGGFTAFPNAGTAARPIKGSAVFWYNLKRNGEPDQTTHHGACPVVLGGNKWVANKWIRANDQFISRKCSTDPSL